MDSRRRDEDGEDFDTDASRNAFLVVGEFFGELAPTFFKAEEAGEDIWLDLRVDVWRVFLFKGAAFTLFFEDVVSALSDLDFRIVLATFLLFLTGGEGSLELLDSASELSSSDDEEDSLLEELSSSLSG